MPLFASKIANCNRNLYMSKMWFVNDYPQHFLATNYQYPFISMIISEKFFSSFLGGLQYWYNMSQTWSFFFPASESALIKLSLVTMMITSRHWSGLHFTRDAAVSFQNQWNQILFSKTLSNEARNIWEYDIFQNSIILKFEHFAGIALICFKRSGLSHFTHIVSESEHCSINNN